MALVRNCPSMSPVKGLLRFEVGESSGSALEAFRFLDTFAVVKGRPASGLGIVFR
jgi:hypothetical protein